MGNAPSQSPEIISNDVISSLSPNSQKKLKNMAFPNFFELASLAIDENTTSNSEYSTKSNTSQETQVSRLSTSSSISKEDKHRSEYERLDGRPYIITDHGFFFLPCDDDESDRMVVLYFLIKFAFNGNVVSPVIQSLRMAQKSSKKSNHPKVLDIGCGPGTWVLEMGTEYPNAEIHGIDIRTMFPNTIKPPNTHFTKHNFIENLPYNDNTFMFIHMQLSLVYFTQDELLHLLSEVYRTLKPGGYFEILDYEHQIHRPGPLSDNLFNNILRDSFFEHGIGTVTKQHLLTLLMTRPTNKGFVNIHQHTMAIPIGWGGQMGVIHLQNITAFLKGIHPCIRYSLCSHDKNLVNSTIDKAINECTEFRSHMNWFVCYCQKPEDPASSMSATNMQLELSTENVQFKNEIHFNTLESISDFSDGYID